MWHYYHYNYCHELFIWHFLLSRAIYSNQKTNHNVKKCFPILSCCLTRFPYDLPPVSKLLSIPDLLGRFAFHIDQAEAAGHGPEEPKELVAWVDGKGMAKEWQRNGKGNLIPYWEPVPWMICLHHFTSSTRMRRGGSCLRFGYKTFSSIELACTVRQPGSCVHAGFARTCCTGVVQEHPRTWRARDHMPMQRQANTFFTLHTVPFTPCTSCFTLALHIPHFISPDFFLPHVTSSQLCSSHPIPSHMSSK